MQLAGSLDAIDYLLYRRQEQGVLSAQLWHLGVGLLGESYQ